MNTQSVSGRETTKPKHPRQIEWNRNVNVYKKKNDGIKSIITSGRDIRIRKPGKQSRLPQSPPRFSTNQNQHNVMSGQSGRPVVT